MNVQVPEWAVKLDSGVGIVRPKRLRWMLIACGVLMLAIGIVMPVTTIGKEGTETGALIGIGAVFVLIGVGLFVMAFTMFSKPVLKVDERGLHRLSMGYVLCPWQDISEIRPGQRGVIQIITPNGRIKKDGSRTRTKTFQIALRSFQGGPHLRAYLTQCWQQAGGYRPPAG